MKKRMGRRALWALPALLLAALIGAACTDTEIIREDPQTNTLSVSGEATVRAEPDIARISIGVSVLRDSVADAQDDAAAQMQAVLDALEADGVSERDIQTEFFSVSPEYDFRTEERELIGFRVANSVAVIVRDLTTISDVLDNAIAAAGNDVIVNGISFAIDDTSALVDEAREMAAADARTRAERLAELTGVDLGAVITVSEGGGPAFGRGGAIFDEAAAFGATPISGGEVEVHMSVFVTYAIEE